jgi:hypothetical protein
MRGPIRDGGISTELHKGFSASYFFFFFNCYNLTIREITLTEIFSKQCWHSKVHDLLVGSRETSFHFDHWPTCQ